jgi:hypothetical protein
MFKQLATSRTLATRARTVGQYEQLVMAMSKGSVNHLDALLHAAINRGAGVQGMIEVLDCAQKGLYKNFTEEEMLHGLLFLGWYTCGKSHTPVTGPAPWVHSCPIIPFRWKDEIWHNLQAAAVMGLKV